MIKNSDKFRKAALTFQKSGRYVSAPPKTTAYRDYWDREVDRCLNGYTAEDGDYITGYHYFYLNYCPIVLVVDKEIELDDGVRRVIGVRERDFPRFWDGDYEYFNAIDKAEKTGQHMVVLKTRRRGYSYKGASMLCRNYFLIPESKSYAVAAENEFLTKDGILTKAWELMSFIDENTAWYKKRQKVDTKMHKRASITVDKDGVKTEIGYLSEIIGVTVKNDVQKIRGKAAKLILFEESGKFPNLISAWNIARSSMDQGGIVFGLMISFGTGGTDQADYEGLKELFYNPKGYNILSLKNIWDEGATKECGFFMPEYMNMDGYMDKDGNSKIEEAKKYAIEQRRLVEEHANDKSSIDRYIAEKPFTPIEATLQLSTNIFPKKDLIRQLNNVLTNNKLFNYKQVGELYWSDTGEVKWDLNEKLRDVSKFPLDKTDSKKGAIVIWEHPPEDIPYGLYVAGCLTPGEKVLTDSGLKNVEDVTLDDKLINKEGEIVNIVNLQRREKVEHDVFKFKMSNSYRTTTFTRGHPLYISSTGYNSNKTINEDEFDFKFIRADQIKVGDWTKWPNVYRNKNNINVFEMWEKYKPTRKVIKNPLLEEDFWWFVGLWLGDGCCYNDKISIAFNKSDAYYINKAKIIINNLINRSPQIRNKGENTVEISFNSKQLCSFLFDTFGKYSYGKYLSEWVKRIEDRFKYQLLWGYLGSDGCITRHTKGYYGTEFVSVSLELLEDFQDILFSLGIVSGLSKMRDSKKTIIRNREVEQKEAFHLRLSHHSSIDFIEGISNNSLNEPYYDHSIYDDPKVKRIDFGNLLELRKRAKDGCFISEDKKYVYFQIRDIEHSLYTGPVYNFECDTHNYISHHISQKNCDPYDHDTSTTESLGSVFIYKRFQDFESYYDILVAEYTARPDTANEFYENVRLLSTYFRATVLYENQNKGLFQYFTTKGSDHLLADQPSIIDDIIKDSVVQRRKGIHMNVAIKEWAERECRDWLNEEYEEGKKNLTKILSVPLLQELISYNDQGNFDRVIALFMIMIYKKELHRVNVKKKKEENKLDRFFTDPMFSNYDNYTLFIN